ncbi:MAG: T3SS effector HopA1 family protein [Pyrinomonadaceae bacterium]
MREQLRAQLRKIVRAVEVRSNDSFNFAGRHFSLGAQGAGHAPHGHGFAQQQANPLAALLEQALYQHCYCRTFDGALREEQADLVHGLDLTPALSEANTSRERWDVGWQVYQVLPSGQVLAHKDGRARSLWPGEFLSTDAPGLAPRPGMNLSVFFMRETKTMQPGFYFAFGEAQEGELDSFSLARFYWNVRVEGAVPLMRAVTRGLNRFQVPFRIKCLTNSAFYARNDPAVLYVDKRFYRVTARVLAGVHREVSRHLRPDAPLFTKPLAPGIGLSRVRGYTLTQEEVYRREAEAALSCTSRTLAAPTAPGQANYSLCHGSAGNAELLLYAARVFGDDTPRLLAEQVGHAGVEQYRKTYSPWPCGVLQGGETPGLLLGLAGIGHFYLRLQDPVGVPSVLIILPEADSGQ